MIYCIYIDIDTVFIHIISEGFVPKGYSFKFQATPWLFQILKCFLVNRKVHGDRWEKQAGPAVKSSRRIVVVPITLGYGSNLTPKADAYITYIM